METAYLTQHSNVFPTQSLKQLLHYFILHKNTPAPFFLPLSALTERAVQPIPTFVHYAPTHFRPPPFSKVQAHLLTSALEEM